MLELKQAIIIRSDLGMDKGKIAAQASHASLSAYIKANEKNSAWVRDWLSFGQKKIVLKVGSKEEITALFESVKKELPTALIKDAGHTQVEPGSITALAIGPAPEELIDKFTSNLKLL